MFVITIEICMGSSCFLRGSGQIVDRFRDLIAERRLEQRVVLKGCFCMEHCTDGVTVKIGEQVFTRMTPQDIDRIFEEEVLPALEREVDGG